MPFLPHRALKSGFAEGGCHEGWRAANILAYALVNCTTKETQLARTKKELAEVKMERDILKKAAAYFGRESLSGTR